MTVGEATFPYHIWSTNISEVEEPPRNQTHAIVKVTARPLESKVLQEVVLVEERIDPVPKLVGAGNRQE